MEHFLPIQAKTNKTVSSKARERHPSQPVQHQHQSKHREGIPTHLRFSLSSIPIEPQAERRQSSDTGHPLPAFVRQKMETALGQDFSDVRIHEGSHVTSLGARAYTQGTDIHFAPGAYQPQSLDGQEVIGHELIHVTQQHRGLVPNTHLISDSPVLEDEADKGAAEATQGRKFHIEQGRAGGRRSGAGGVPIQLLGEEEEKKKKRKLQQAQRITLQQPQPQQARLTTLQQPQRAYVESIEPSPQPQQAQRVPEQFSQQQVQYVAGAISQRGQLFPGIGTQQTQPKSPVEIPSEQETSLVPELEEEKQPSEGIGPSEPVQKPRSENRGYTEPARKPPPENRGYTNIGPNKPLQGPQSQAANIPGSEPSPEVSSQQRAEDMRSDAIIKTTQALLERFSMVTDAKEYPEAAALKMIAVLAKTLQGLLSGEAKNPKIKQLQASTTNVLDQLLSAIPKIQKEVEEDREGRWPEARSKLINFQANLVEIFVKIQYGIPL